MKFPGAKSLGIAMLLLFAPACSNVDANKAKAIFGEIDQLLDQKAAAANEILEKPNIFSEEYLKDFPKNRETIRPIATEQIALFEKLNEIDKAQLSKLGQIAALRLEDKFKRDCGLMIQIQQKRMENIDLGIQIFGLFQDEEINSRQMLEARISQIRQKQSSIDSDIAGLEQLRKENREGK